MLNLEKITQIGNTLDNELADCSEKNIELVFTIDENQFKKVDEDLFYRLKKDGDFIPSDEEIKVSFKKFSFVIKKRNPLQ